MFTITVGRVPRRHNWKVITLPMLPKMYDIWALINVYLSEAGVKCWLVHISTQE